MAPSPASEFQSFPQSNPISLPNSLPHDVSTVRLFVGGLPADVTHEELQARFKPFGKVVGLEVVPQKEGGESCRGFAYVDLEPASGGSLSKCFTVYNGAKWRGGRLRVEKARTTYMERLTAEWASESTGLPEGLEKQEDAPGPSDGTAQASEPSDRKTVKPKIFEPLKLKWGTWEHEKKIKVMPAAGGVKIKKSFRNVPEKSLWELEGMGGEGALSRAKGAQNTGASAGTGQSTGPFDADGNGASSEGKAEGSAGLETGEKLPGGVTEQGADLGGVTGGAANVEGRVGSEENGGVDVSGDAGGQAESEESEGRTDDDMETGNVGDDKRVSGKVNKKVRELSAWEKLLQKAAAGPEDDGLSDEEAGGLEGLAGPAEVQGEGGTSRGADGKQGDQKDRVSLDNKQPARVGKEKADVGLGAGLEIESKSDGLGDGLRKKPEATGGVDVGLSDWERLMQKAAGEFVSEDSENDNSNLDGGGGDVETKEYQESGSDQIDGSDGSEESNGSDAEVNLDEPNGIEREDDMREAGKIADRGDSQSDGSGSDWSEEGLGDPSAGGEEESGSEGESGSDTWEEGSEDDVKEDGGSDADVSEGETESEGAEGSLEGSSERFLEDLRDVGLDGANKSEGVSEESGSEGSELDDLEEDTDSEGNDSDGEGNGLASSEDVSGGERDDSDGGGTDSEASGMPTEEDDLLPETREGVAGSPDDLEKVTSDYVRDPHREGIPSNSDGGEADFETAPEGAVANETEDGSADSAGAAEAADGTGGTEMERTAEEEEIARQLAEERKRQLGILGAMFPGDARFFREESSQKPKPPSGFLPVARYDPSAAAKTDAENGSASCEDERNADTVEPQKNGSAGDGVKPERTGRKTGVKAEGSRIETALGGKVVKSRDASGEDGAGKLPHRKASVKRKEGREGLGRTAKGVSKGRVDLTESEGGNEGGSVGTDKREDGNGLVVRSGNGNGGPSGLAMVGEVVSQLSPQVLKYLDAGLLKRLTSAEKRVGSTEKWSKSSEKRGLTSDKEGLTSAMEGLASAMDGLTSATKPPKSVKKGLTLTGMGLTSEKKPSKSAENGLKSVEKALMSEKERKEDRGKRKRESTGQGEREGRKREKLRAGVESGDGTERTEAGRRNDGSERVSKKRTHGDSVQPEDTSLGTETVAPEDATGKSEPGGQPGLPAGEQGPGGKAGLSTEERKRLKREKRAQRRGEEGAAPLDAAEPAAEVKQEVKQEVFVNPAWRALVGYVGTGKPTFSLASVLGGGPEIGPSDTVGNTVRSQVSVSPGPYRYVENPSRPGLVSNIEASAANVASGPGQNVLVSIAGQTGLGVSAVVSDVVPAAEPPRADVTSGAPVQAVGRSNPVGKEKPMGTEDEDLGLSFVRSATAEREWLASKSALSIDYKRKKRVAMRVAPGGGKKRG